jgi:hypothetical protein
MSSTTAFHVPIEIADAVRAEAFRTLRRPGDVLTEFVRVYWAEFIAGRLRVDLRHPDTVIDAIALYSDARDSHELEAGT